MALLRYMQIIPHRGELPDPLSADFKPSLIKAANAAGSATREAKSGSQHYSLPPVHSSAPHQ